MNFKKILATIKGPALALASTLIPGGPVLLAAYNASVPEDKKLPETATGAEIHTAVNNLPPDQRASLMEKELEVEIAEIAAWADIQESMAKADATGSSTRPTIAMMMAWIIVIEIAIVIIVWSIAVYSKNNETLTILNNSWTMLTALIATPTALLYSYFGMRTKEKKARYSAMSGVDVTGGLTGLIKSLIK